MDEVRFAWLEITGRCQLRCSRCYADSGPDGSAGLMNPEDWMRVIDQISGMGGRMVQFIGGEPTTHPALSTLIDHALEHDMGVEVFSNLVAVPNKMWEVLARPGVRLATSYYSDDATEHDAITGRHGSHTRTRANIVTAVHREIPLRVGVIDVLDGQRVEQALTELAMLEVTEVGLDRVRAVGRGTHTKPRSTDGLAAVGCHRQDSAL
ncbi:MAG: radical SAM protein [Kutzneria sp.]|nr:radical SAM protein [Kutzneria sp.]